MDGWMDGREGAKASLRIAYSNQKIKTLKTLENMALGSSMSEETDYTFRVVIIHSDTCRTKTCLNEMSKNFQERIIMFSRSRQNQERIIFRYNMFSEE